MATATPSGPNLLDLPVELLEALVLSPSLSVPDICSLSRVCWTLNGIVSRLWMKIAKSRWQHHCKSMVVDGDGESRDWHKLCRHHYLCEVHTYKMLSQLTKKGVHVVHMSGDELDCFVDFLKTWDCPVDVLLCVLNSILQCDKKKANLTHQHYALFGKEYLVWSRLAGDWRDLLSHQDDPQILEKGAVLLSQWMNPCREISASFVHSQLDSIAEQVSVELLQACKDVEDTELIEREKSVSSLSSESVEGREGIPSKLRRLDLPTEVVLDTINSVLYSTLQFAAPPMDQYYNLENSFIDRVLVWKRGLPITMCIIYQGVARRLGVNLRPINFPSHFVLQIPSQSGSSADGTDCMYVDAFARGVRRSYMECCAMISRVPKVEVADPTEVFMRMTGNIYSQSYNSIFAVQNLDREYDKEINQWGSIAVTSALNLQLVLCSLAEVKPGSTVIHRALHLAHMSLELNYSTKKVRELATKLESCPEGHRFSPIIANALKVHSSKEKMFEEPLQPKERSNGLSYRVGMIMKHRRYDYRCVIYGWDHTCKMSESWISRMGVDRLPNGRNQPFYHVFVEDGTNRYASQGETVHWLS